jgi:hypothetical protein
MQSNKHVNKRPKLSSSSSSPSSCIPPHLCLFYPVKSVLHECSLFHNHTRFSNRRQTTELMLANTHTHITLTFERKPMRWTRYTLWRIKLPQFITTIRFTKVVRTPEIDQCCHLNTHSLHAAVSVQVGTANNTTPFRTHPHTADADTTKSLQVFTAVVDQINGLLLGFLPRVVVIRSEISEKRTVSILRVTELV